MEAPKQSVVLRSHGDLPGNALACLKVRLMRIGLQSTALYAVPVFYTSPLTHSHKSEGGFTPNPKIKAGWPYVMNRMNLPPAKLSRGSADLRVPQEHWEAVQRPSRLGLLCGCKATQRQGGHHEGEHEYSAGRHLPCGPDSCRSR